MRSDDRTIHFAEFELDSHTLELRRGGVPVRLQQQPARLLAVLIEHAGDLVTRETLQKTLWGDDTFVDFDRGLNYSISQIRIALGDSAGLLETLRGRGYRLLVERRPPSAADFSREPGGRSGRRSTVAIVIAALLVIAVALLVSNRTPSAIGIAPLTAPANEQQWTNALRAQIVSHLVTASRTPVIDLVANPNADTRWRVEGRVDRSNAQYRVTMLLRDTRDGSVRWSDIFAGRPGDWVDAQSEMAERMTEIIRYRIEGPSAGLPMRRAKLPWRAKL